MIILMAMMQVDPAKRDEALRSAAAMIAAAKAEPGCLEYAWSADLSVPGRLWIYEEWQDEASLAAHFAGPHYVAMRDHFVAAGLSDSKAFKHRVSESGPVYDDTGTARADFF